MYAVGTKVKKVVDNGNLGATGVVVPLEDGPGHQLLLALLGLNIRVQYDVPWTSADDTVHEAGSAGYDNSANFVPISEDKEQVTHAHEELSTS